MIDISNKIKLIAALVAGIPSIVLGISHSAEAASFTIDKFYSNGNGSQYVEVKRNNTTNASSQFSSRMAVGGYRDLALTNATGFGTSNTRKAGAEVEGGNLSWSNDTNIWSDLTVTWDGNDSPTTLNKTGLSDLDLTKNSKLDGIFIQLFNPDLTARTYTDIAFNIYNTNGDRYSLSQKVSNLITRDGKDGLMFDFKQFNKFVGTSSTSSGLTTISNFQNIGAIQMTVKTSRTNNASKGIDLNLGIVEVVDNDVEVPEPTASLVVFGGFALLGATIRQKKA